MTFADFKELFSMEFMLSSNRARYVTSQFSFNFEGVLWNWSVSDKTVTDLKLKYPIIIMHIVFKVATCAQVYGMTF